MNICKYNHQIYEPVSVQIPWSDINRGEQRFNLSNTTTHCAMFHEIKHKIIKMPGLCTND